MRIRRQIKCTATVLVIMLTSMVWAGTAQAATPTPWWSVTSGARPSSLEPEGAGELVVTAENVGEAPVGNSNAPAEITDTLPVGLKAVKAAAAIPLGNIRTALPCSVISGSEVTCKVDLPVEPYEAVEVRIAVQVEAGAHSGELNQFSVTGAGAPAATGAQKIVVGNRAGAFGVQSYSLLDEEVGGIEARQAGSHPLQQTTSLELNQTADTAPLNKPPNAEPVALPKDIAFKWPAGMIGNPTTIPQCSQNAFLASVGDGDENECPATTAIGVATVTVNEPSLFNATVFVVPVFNLEPERGEPARVGFNVVEANTPVYIDTALRTGDDYGITVKSNNITETAGFLSAKVTIWGVPGAANHDGARGWGCLFRELGASSTKPCNLTEGHEQRPFLRLPTSCDTPLESVVEGDTWSHPSEKLTLARFSSPNLIGCNDLTFNPRLAVSSDTAEADRPTGLHVDVHVPQEADENPIGLAGSGIRSISVILPREVTVNPAAAGGLEGCSESQIGYLAPPVSSPPSVLHFTGGSGLTACPAGAKLASVTIHTPLLPRPLTGALYLASPQNFLGIPPQENPFESLIALYLVAEDPTSGSLVKLPGKVSLNPDTGQVSTSFENTPDVDFEDAEIDFYGGDRAALSTPEHCARYTTEATFEPWSRAGAVVSTADFDVTSGPGGTPCPQSPGFSPAVSAGSGNLQAGAFTPVQTSISRSDGEQAIRSVSVQLPPGMAGILNGVALCGEAAANAGSCSPASLIGHASASVGVGDDPYDVTGGQVFLTEGYKGAPFGLSVVTPAVAGPFNLGEVIVRARVAVDPHTAQITVTTDDAAPYDIPEILEGVPVQIKRLNVLIDRPGFSFNPTYCNGLNISASLNGYEGGVGHATVPFRVANCATLHFAPKLTAKTSGKASRLNGIGFSTRLVYPTGGQGTQANIRRVKVDLPRQLPSRTTTLQKACPSQVFERNPGDCRAESRVGSVTVQTPVLPVPLRGPAYLVSHGNEAFPALTIVLQGYGITVDLVGSTFIHKGVTSTTFKSVPDVPFSSFELTLPSGRFSALGGFGNLCRSKPRMTVAYLAQSGAEIHTTTPVAVGGCKKKA